LVFPFFVTLWIAMYEFDWYSAFFHSLYMAYPTESLFLYFCYQIEILV
jgi:hypothetical protein